MRTCLNVCVHVLDEGMRHIHGLMLGIKSNPRNVHSKFQIHVCVYEYIYPYVYPCMYIHREKNENNNTYIIGEKGLTTYPN